MPTPQPTKLDRLSDRGLQITWSDGQIRDYTIQELRDKCPCATCREKRKAEQPATLLPVLSPEEARPLTLNGMKPVGNYAYSLEFSDGHDTGIFTFESLLEMGETKADD